MDENAGSGHAASASKAKRSNAKTEERERQQKEKGMQQTESNSSTKSIRHGGNKCFTLFFSNLTFSSFDPYEGNFVMGVFLSTFK